MDHSITVLEQICLYALWWYCDVLKQLISQCLIYFNVEKLDFCRKTSLDACISAIVKKWFVCHTVTYDLRCPSLDLRFAVHAWPDDYSASGCQWGVFVKEIEGSEEETYRISWRRRVRDVLWVRHVQEADSHPGNQILPIEELVSYVLKLALALVNLYQSVYLFVIKISCLLVVVLMNVLTFRTSEDKTTVCFLFL